jgi:hypothetical protein
MPREYQEQAPEPVLWVAQGVQESEGDQLLFLMDADLYYT